MTRLKPIVIVVMSLTLLLGASATGSVAAETQNNSISYSGDVGPDDDYFEVTVRLVDKSKGPQNVSLHDTSESNLEPTTSGDVGSEIQNTFKSEPEDGVLIYHIPLGAIGDGSESIGVSEDIHLLVDGSYKTYVTLKIEDPMTQTVDLNSTPDEIYQKGISIDVDRDKITNESFMIVGDSSNVTFEYRINNSNITISDSKTVNISDVDGNTTVNIYPTDTISGYNNETVTMTVANPGVSNIRLGPGRPLGGGGGGGDGTFRNLILVIIVGAVVFVVFDDDSNIF